MLCASPGHDPSPHVDALAAQSNQHCIVLAMGSPVGCADAERAIRNASKSGGWVLLKNVHLVPHWLPTLEKLLHATLHAVEARASDDSNAAPHQILNRRGGR